MTVSHLRLVGALAALLSLGSGASANLIPVFTAAPNSILDGSAVTLDLQLSLFADSGYSDPQFTGGSVTINPGDGSALHTFSIGNGGTIRDFSFLQTYLAAGSYLPSFTASITYSESYTQREVLYSYVSCNRFYCPGSISVYGDATHTMSNTTTLSGNMSLSVLPHLVPVPGPTVGAGVPGLAVICAAFIAWWRRKRKAVVVSA
jgi:hypothetical protein